MFEYIINFYLSYFDFFENTFFNKMELLLDEYGGI